MVHKTEVSILHLYTIYTYNLDNYMYIMYDLTQLLNHFFFDS